MKREDLLSWPEVPVSDRPKPLFHIGLVDEKVGLFLINAGWKPTDVRLMPSNTDDDRRASLKAMLEGIRFGTIEMDPKISKWLELETKVYEIHKGVPTKNDSDTPQSDVQSSDFVLSFGRQSPWSTTTADKDLLTRRKKPHAKKKDLPPKE